MPDPRTKVTMGCHVLLLDCSGHILYSGECHNLGLVAGQRMPIDDVVEDFLETSEIRLPGSGNNHRFRFIGDDRMGTHPILATPRRAAQFSQGQLRRALNLHAAMNMVLKDRFEIMGNKADAPLARGVNLLVHMLDEKSGGLSVARVSALSLAWVKLHNFLVDKSPTYGDVFKDLHD